MVGLGCGSEVAIVFGGQLGLQQFSHWGKGVDNALQSTHKLADEVATSIDAGEGVELSFHDIVT